MVFPFDPAKPLPYDNPEIQERLANVRRRLEALAQDREQPIAGLDKIMAGLAEMLPAIPDATDADASFQPTLLEVLAQGLDTLAGLFEGAAADAPLQEEEAPPEPRAQGLQQFISAFRKEAKKRLSGLSISMMGIFNEDESSESLERSAGHLHAIRGGAAMLSLGAVAELSGLMEQVILTMRKVPPTERVWPTTALMRGFQLIEHAIEDPAVYIDPAESAETLLELRGCLDSLSTKLHLTPDPPTTPRAPAPPQPATPKTPTPARPATPDIPLEEGLSVEISTVMEQRILIVDDIETIAASVGFVLSDLELPLDIASNGQMALDMMRERPYSLVITDVAMPRLDGIALTKIIRNDESFKDIPVILLTALDHPTERDLGLEAGANDYIIKGSIGGGELVHRVRELLKIAPHVPADSLPHDGRRRILVAEDTETVAASIAFVLSEGDFDIVLTSDGHEALKRIKREPFDLLISDWQMPNMSGFELIQAVRGSQDVTQLPIVLLTSLDSDKVRADAYAAGADRFLVKGEVGGGNLLDMVEELTAAPYTPP